MKRSFLFYLLIMIFGLTLGVSNSFALGLGVTYGTGSGSGEFDPDADIFDEYEDDSSDYDAPSFDIDTSYSGFGFVLDTNVSKDALFNYRLDLQYGTFTYENDYGWEIDLDQFTMDHTFGFRIYRNELVRIWLGPQIRLSYATGDYKNRIDYTQYGFGIAPVVGVNFNPGKVVSPALTVGYRYQGIYGTRDGGGTDDDYTATDSALFLNLTLLFRLNE